MSIFNSNSFPSLLKTTHEKTLARKIKLNIHSSLTWKILLERLNLHYTYNDKPTIKFPTIIFPIAKQKIIEASSEKFVAISPYKGTLKKTRTEQNHQLLKNSCTTDQTDRTEIDETELNDLTPSTDSEESLSKLVKFAFCDFESTCAMPKREVNRSLKFRDNNYLPQSVEKSYKKTMREDSLPATDMLSKRRKITLFPK